MTRKTYGILASVIGAAVSAWWWQRQRSGRTHLATASARGRVIYDNTPTPTGLSEERSL